MTEVQLNKIPVLNPSIRFHSRDNEHIISFDDSNRHLRINNHYFDLLILIDNKKSIEEIVSVYNRTHPESIDSDTAYQLLYSKLDKHNIITNDGNISEKFVKPSYLKLSAVLLNSKTTQVLATPFLFLFNKNVLRIFPLVCILILSAIFFSRFETIINFLTKIPVTLFLAYGLLMTVSSIFHEIGHAAATYYSGGRCSSIGFGFYLFTPVLYADVSDAWKFNTKQRVIVNFAGIYFELVFCTAITIIAFLAGNKFLLVLPIIIFIKTLLNLNPFFRNDGYWILSDALKCPNLSSISDAKLKELLRKRSFANKNPKDIFLLLYSLINNAFIIIFLATYLLINPSAIIMFPVNLYEYVFSFQGKEGIDLVYLGTLLIPLTFYYLFIRYALKYFRKINFRKIFYKSYDARKK